MIEDPFEGCRQTKVPTYHGEVLKFILNELDLDRSEMTMLLTTKTTDSPFERLQKLRLIQCITMLNILKGDDEDCVRYVFIDEKKESWNMKRGQADAEAFVHETRRFLLEHGYYLVLDAPLSGDVAAYGENLLTGTKRNPEEFTHFGIVRENLRVESKLNGIQGSVIFQHPLKLNHLLCGDELVFFRKKENT